MKGLDDWIMRPDEHLQADEEQPSRQVDALLACPFCGGEAIEQMFTVSCSKCRATTDPYNYDTLANDKPWVKNWNKRVS